MSPVRVEDTDMSEPISNQLQQAASRRFGATERYVHALGVEVEETLRAAHGEAEGVINPAEAKRIAASRNAVGAGAGYALEHLLSGLKMPSGASVSFSGDARQILERARSTATNCLGWDYGRMQVCAARNIR